MRIISEPWIAINIDSDCVRVAYPTAAREDGSFDVATLEPAEHAFDTVFHYSRAEKQWTFGAEAWDAFERDGTGLVALPFNPLHWERPVDDASPVRASELLVRLLRYVREYCEVGLFEGRPIRSCVISIQHRYNTIRSVHRSIAEAAGFRQILFRDAMVAGALLWKSEWQLDRNYVLACHIGDSRITTSLLKKSFQGFMKTGIRSHNIHFGANRFDEHVLARLCGETPCPSEARADRLALIRKFRVETMLKSVQKKHLVEIDGEYRTVEPAQRTEAMKDFVEDLYGEFAPFLEIVSQKTAVPLSEIPFIVLGMGRYDADLETIFQARLGRDVEWSYFWPHSEYAIPLGLALMMQPPRKLPGDLDEATRARRRWYADAEQSDNYRAQYRLGRKLEDGRGICPVEEEAVDWFRLAAAQGYPRALFRLAYMIARDKGTDYEPEELETVVADLENRGFDMEAFRQGVARFQEGREIEIENQKVMNPDRLDLLRRLKKEAEEDFQRCRDENGAFASSRQRFIPTVAAPAAPPVLDVSVPAPPVFAVPVPIKKRSIFARLLDFLKGKRKK